MRFDQQWHLKNTGQTGNWGYAGTPGADIGAEAAWNTTRGAGVRIAIVDHGFDVHHPDLAAALEGALQTALHLRVPVHVVPPGSLPRFEMKASRWIRQ